ncbi:MAG: ThuA domain-containing protein [Planctomycetes bacterium]|nr:ThuA domain-containing protein [Planctomycetota bacterium]
MANDLSRRAFLGSSALAVGALSLPAMAAPAKKKLVILAGSPSHGPGEHEFNAGTKLLQKCLGGYEGLEISYHTGGWPKDESAFDGADGIFCYADGGGRHPLVIANHLEVIGKLMKKGVGLFCAHYGVEVPKDLGGKEFQEWIGGSYETLWSCNPMWKPEFKEFPKHPVTRGVQPFSVRDEWYFNMRFRPEMKGVTPLLSAIPSDAVRNGPYVSPKGPYPHIQEAKGKAETMMWAVERPDGGRGAGFTGGHFHQNWGDDNFRKIVLNALVWICKLEVPADGVVTKLSADELKENLDPKPPRKK